MNDQELQNKLDQLRSSKFETEVLEFKEAKAGFDFNKLGKYFSALCNEANLKRKPCAWLIFGIADKHHAVVGTKYREDQAGLDKLKAEIAEKITNRITFIEIYEVITSEGRVLMFQIPAAPKGLPIAFEGHYYGRDGEQLVPLNIEEFERIRIQLGIEDWSAAVIKDASIEDLDEEAIRVARINFKTKFAQRSADVDTWDDITFLNKAKITIKGKITRTAIILLGKEESEAFISPSEAKVRWILKDLNGNDRDYHIVCCPLLLSVDKIYAKIRNLKYRYLKDEHSLFPEEVDQYEPFTIREALNNCIAHQDYAMAGRINVVEMDSKLIFTNLGVFIPGDVERVVKDDAPEEYYRNKFLANAMFNLGMVDTAGGGIKKMFNFQRQRSFPMPDYNLTKERVQVTIYGSVLNADYAHLLTRNQDLSLDDIIILDKVQKKKEITEEEEKYLKSKKLIEGRKPNFFIGKKIAQDLGKKVAYSKNKAFDKQYYLDMIIMSITKHGSMTRLEIDELLTKMLSEVLDEKQKTIKINNLLSELRKAGRIRNEGNRRDPSWILDN